MLYNIIYTGRIAGPTGCRCCEFFHCKQPLRVYSLQSCLTALEIAREVLGGVADSSSGAGNGSRRYELNI